MVEEEKKVVTNLGAKILEAQRKKKEPEKKTKSEELGELEIPEEIGGKYIEMFETEKAKNKARATLKRWEREIDVQLKKNGISDDDKANDFVLDFFKKKGGKIAEVIKLIEKNLSEESKPTVSEKKPETEEPEPLEIVAEEKKQKPTPKRFDEMAKIGHIKDPRLKEKLLANGFSEDEPISKIRKKAEELQAKKKNGPKIEQTKYILEEFNEEFGPFLKTNLFKKDGDPNHDWIYIRDFEPKGGKVEIFDGNYKEGKKPKWIDPNKLKKILEAYKSEKKPATEKTEEDTGVPSRVLTSEKEPKTPDFPMAEDRPNKEELEVLLDYDPKSPSGENPKITKTEDAEIIELTDLAEKEPEYKEENGKEKPKIDEQELEKLKTEVERTRKEYLEIDYKKNKAYSRIYKVLGGLFKNKENRNLENDQDIAWYRAQYNDKLFDYKNALLENAKIRKISNKELGELVNIFEMEARINIADTHDQVKIENHEGRLPGFFKEQSLEMVQWYKKLPLAKKIAIAAAFGFGTLAVGVTGSAMAIGTVASAATMKRIFMGMVTGTTVALGAEALTRKRSERKVEKESAGFVKKTEGLNEEDMLRMTEEHIKKLIFDEDRKINKIKNKNLRNLFFGVAAGSIVGSGALSYIFEKTGATGLVKEKIAHYFGSTEVPVESGGSKIRMKIPDHTVSEAPIPPHDTLIPGENHIASQEPGMKGPRPRISIEDVAKEKPSISAAEVVIEAGKNIELTVPENSSFEGSIIKYLTEHGVEKGEAGKMAHRMWDEFSEKYSDPGTHDYNLIHPGAKLEIMPNVDGTYRVVSFHDSAPGSDWIGNPKEAVHKIAEELKTHEAVEKLADDIKTENAVGEISENLKTEDVIGKTVETSAPNNLPIGPDMEELGVKAAETGLGQNEMAMTGAAAAGTIGVKKMTERIKNKDKKVIDLTEKRKAKAFKELSKYGFEKDQSPAKRAFKIIKEISNGKKSRWLELTKMTVSQALKDKKIKTLEKNLVNYLGSDVKPERGGSFKDWLFRNIRESVKIEKGSVEFKMAA